MARLLLNRICLRDVKDGRGPRPRVPRTLPTVLLLLIVHVLRLLGFPALRRDEGNDLDSMFTFADLPAKGAPCVIGEYVWTHSPDYTFVVPGDDMDVFWRPAEPSNPAGWLEYAQPPQGWSDEQRLMAWCFRLAAVHDLHLSRTQSPLDRIFWGTAYSGRFQRNELAWKLDTEIRHSDRGVDDLAVMWQWVKPRLQSAPDKPPVGKVELGGAVRQPVPPVTLEEFMREYCESTGLGDAVFESRKTCLFKANTREAIKLPKHVGKWTSGKPKHFRVCDLTKQWPSYCEQFPNLPRLKTASQSE